MKTRIRQILHDADRLGEWEFPSDAAENPWPKIREIAADLSRVVGTVLDIDNGVQDASFLTDVGLLDAEYYDRTNKTGALVYIFAFRFSNFGRLFTLHGREWKTRYEEFNLGVSVELISRNGFQYVESDQLNVPYDGINGPNNPICGTQLTWWIRFFDYI